MIAMQYRLPLPANYDMAIIDQRIADKGHLTDGLPNLLFKAYLTQRQSQAAKRNLYAPFYVWQNAAGLSDFLCSAGFKGLTQAFDWPSVATWITWGIRTSSVFSQARSATCERIAIEPFSDLHALRQHWLAELDTDLNNPDLLLSWVGFEPTTWQLLRFQLWAQQPTQAQTPDCVYEVGYISVDAALANH